jgi:hypothetical protein
MDLITKLELDNLKKQEEKLLMEKAENKLIENLFNKEEGNKIENKFWNDPFNKKSSNILNNILTKNPANENKNIKEIKSELISDSKIEIKKTKKSKKKYYNEEEDYDYDEDSKWIDYEEKFYNK